MSKQLPATAIIELVTAVGATISIIGSVLADGKVDVWDLMHLGKLAGTVSQFTKVQWAQVMPQLWDMDDQERAQVLEAFNKAVKLSNPSAQAMLKEGASIFLTKGFK